MAVSHYPAARFLTSAAEARQFPPDAGSEVAFAGRSNVGKSTAINVLLERRGLARVSKTPGRTRLLNFFELRPGQRIVDLPGYGFAAASAAERASWEPMIAALARRRCLRGLVLLVDSRRGVLPDDLHLCQWAAAAGKPVHVLFSKVDKLSRSEQHQQLARAADSLGAGVALQPFSATAGIGVDQAREQLERWSSGAGG